jgi:hypothetical protein
MMKRKVLWALLAAGMTVVLTGIVSAQSIVGSWEETVTFPAGVPISPQLSVVTFHDDGTILASGQGMVIAHPGGKNAQVETDGLGVWEQLPSPPSLPPTFEYTNEAVLSDLKGTLTGFFKVRGVYTLVSENHYTGHSYYQFLGPGHEDTGPDGWVCNDGVRIQLESPPMENPPECVGRP